jgi:hypothetical protein
MFVKFGNLFVCTCIVYTVCQEIVGMGVEIV